MKLNRLEFILEDVSIETFKKGIGLIWYRTLDHPYKQMYTVKEFTDFIESSGLKIIKYKESNPFGLVKFFSLIASKSL